MRKLLLAIALFALVSCAPPPGAAPGPPGAPPGRATTIQASPENLSFLGTSTATLNVTANGPWSAEPQQPWLQVSPASGTGNAAVTVTVTRTGLAPSHYAGSILFRGDLATREVVTVYMRFPNVRGNISGPPNQVRPGSVQPTPQASAQTAPGLEYVPGEVTVALEPVAVALSLSQARLVGNGDKSRPLNPGQRHPWGRLDDMAAPFAGVVSALSAYEPKRLQEVRRFLFAGLGHLDVVVYTPDELAEGSSAATSSANLLWQRPSSSMSGKRKGELTRMMGKRAGFTSHNGHQLFGRESL